MKPRRFVRSLLVVAIIGLASAHASAAPFAIEQSRSNEVSPQIAHDSASNRHLVVWAAGGGVNGRIIGADGVPVGSDFPIFWQTSSARYSQPSVTFKTNQNRYIVAVKETYTLPAGLELYAIVVRVLDQNGTQVAQRWLFSPPMTTAEPSRPVVVADTYGSTCCILVAWQDDVHRDISGMLINPDATPRTSPAVIASSTVAGRLVNPSATYRRDYDMFVLAYEQDPNSGSTSVRFQTMAAFTATLYQNTHVYTRSVDGTGTYPKGAAKVAVNGNTVLFVWSDLGDTWARAADTDGANILPYGPRFQVNDRYRWTGSRFAMVDTLNGASLISTDAINQFTVAVVEDVESSTASHLSTYRVRINNVGDPVIARRDTFSSSDDLQAPAVCYSPASNRLLSAFQLFTHPLTNQNDIWGNTHTP